MRRTKMLWILCVVVLAAVPTLAQDSIARARLQGALEELEDYNFELGDGGRGGSWWIWNMRPNTYNQVDRTFYRGNTYALVAAGDDRVSDVDIKVYDENWNLIDSDEDSSDLAIVTFTPRWSGRFHIRTIYYSGRSIASVGFFVAYR